MALLQTFVPVGLEAVPCTAKVRPDQKRVRFRCERELDMPLEWELDPPRHFRRGRGAPADLRKDAGGFDLPIALGLLVAIGQLRPESFQGCAVMGELALDGSLRPIKGALSMAMAAAQRGIQRLVVPDPNAREAAVVEAVAVYGVGSLAVAVYGTGSRAIVSGTRATHDGRRRHVPRQASAIG
jgi:hypothetical protein